jgi:hypothetical protein
MKRLLKETVPKRQPLVQAMTMQSLCEKSGTLKKRFLIPLVLTALYAPQLWLFFESHPRDDHWLSWLRLFPGLHVFAPVEIFFHFTKGFLPRIAFGLTECIFGPLVIIALLIIGRKYPKGFWSALAAATAISIWSALAARSLFLM